MASKIKFQTPDTAPQINTNFTPIDQVGVNPESPTDGYTRAPNSNAVYSMLQDIVAKNPIHNTGQTPQMGQPQ